MPFVDFAALKAALAIEEVARHMGLTIRPEGAQFRSACPACNQGGDRAIVLTPSKGLFYCFAAKEGGDCIKLAAHLLGVKQHDAALYLADQIGTEPVPVQLPDRDSTVRKVHATVPTEPGEPSTPARTAAPSPQKKGEREFDPQAYAAKLDYEHESVQALGLSKEEARELCIGHSSTGFHKNSLVFALRWPSGEIAAFVSATDLKFPRQLLPAKVVQLKRA